MVLNIVEITFILWLLCFILDFIVFYPIWRQQRLWFYACEKRSTRKIFNETNIEHLYLQQIIFVTSLTGCSIEGSAYKCLPPIFWIFKVFFNCTCFITKWAICFPHIAADKFFFTGGGSSSNLFLFFIQVLFFVIVGRISVYAILMRF